MDARKALYKVLLVGAGMTTLFKLASAPIDKKIDISDLLNSNVYAGEVKAEEAEASVAEKSLVERIKEAEIRVKENPTAENYVKLGDLYYEANNIDKLGEVSKRAVGLYPDSSNVRNNLGLFYVSKRMYNEAEKELEIAVKLDPKNNFAYANLGWLYSEQKQFEKAVPYLKKSIELNPKEAMAHYNLGVTYYDMGKPREAIGELNEALRLDPNHKKTKDWIKYIQKKYPEIARKI